MSEKTIPTCCIHCDHLGSWATAEQLPGELKLTAAEQMYYERDVNVCKYNGLEIEDIEERPTWCPMG